MYKCTFQPSDFTDRVVLGSLDGSNIPEQARPRRWSKIATPPSSPKSRRFLSLPSVLKIDNITTQSTDRRQIQRKLKSIERAGHHGHHNKTAGMGHATNMKRKSVGRRSPLLVTLPYPVGRTCAKAQRENNRVNSCDCSMWPMPCTAIRIASHAILHFALSVLNAANFSATAGNYHPKTRRPAAVLFTGTIVVIAR